MTNISRFSFSILKLFLKAVNKPLITSKVMKFPPSINSILRRLSDIRATEGVTSLKKVTHQSPERDLQPWHKSAVLVRLALSNKSFGQQQRHCPGLNVIPQRWMEGAGGGFRTSFMSKGAHLQAVSSHNRIRSLLNGITATTQVTFRLIRALRRTRSHTWPASSSASINLTPNVDTNANHSHDTGFFGPDFPALSFGALNPYFLSLSWPTLSPGLPFFSPLAAASQQRGTEHLIVCEEAHRQCFY